MKQQQLLMAGALLAGAWFLATREDKPAAKKKRAEKEAERFAIRGS